MLFARQIYFLGKPEPLGWLKEKLILEHDIPEIWFLLKKSQEFVKCNAQIIAWALQTLNIKFLNHLVPIRVTLHYGLLQPFEESLH
jgi:hypothetical protein